MPDTPAFNVVSSHDLDHYRAQPGNWNVQVSQLSKGSFGSHIRSLSPRDNRLPQSDLFPVPDLSARGYDAALPVRD
jgi:hypothetical protein